MKKCIELKKALHIVDIVTADKGIRRKCKAIRKRLKELPGEDVEKVRHGKWVEEYPGSDNIVCPACGKLWNVLDNCTEEFDRCPKCGCVMNGKKEGSNNG